MEKIPMTARVLSGIKPEQLVDIFREVSEHHMLITGRKIKYSDLHWDVRSNTVFSLGFRGWSADTPKVFTVTNRFDTDRVDLYAEVMEWLTSGREDANQP